MREWLDSGSPGQGVFYLLYSHKTSLYLPHPSTLPFPLFSSFSSPCFLILLPKFPHSPPQVSSFPYPQYSSVLIPLTNILSYLTILLILLTNILNLSHNIPHIPVPNILVPPSPYQHSSIVTFITNIPLVNYPVTGNKLQYSTVHSIYKYTYTAYCEVNSLQILRGKAKLLLTVQ